jgi:hypothetical protein
MNNRKSKIANHKSARHHCVNHPDRVPYISRLSIEGNLVELCFECAYGKRPCDEKYEPGFYAPGGAGYAGYDYESS